MKRIVLTGFSLLVLGCTSFASGDEDSTKACYQAAKKELIAMLNGQQPASYERAIFLIENAYWENGLDYRKYKAFLDWHTENINTLFSLNKSRFIDEYHPAPLQSAMQSKQNRLQLLEQLGKNWSIYTYMKGGTVPVADRPNTYFIQDKLYSYSNYDPFGTQNWNNTLVTHLLNTGYGNCFALASLYKIFSDRLLAEATVSIAPSHIFIRHPNEKGLMYNIELSNGSFPGSGTIETLTYTTNDATNNNIAMRDLDTKQAIALCLVYLAKGYEQKFTTDNDSFMSDCALKALAFDYKNLNAMLMQFEILQKRILKTSKKLDVVKADKEFIALEKLTNKLYHLGYREMPLDMKNKLIQSWTRDSSMILIGRNYNPPAFNRTGVPNTRYASLTWGIFDEEIPNKPFEQYGSILFNTKTGKIESIVEAQPLYNNYNFDPVVFAMNIDPLAHEYPGISPYSAFAGNPIMFTDHNGAYVEGADGKKVTYRMLTNGKIQWSANTTADAKRIGNAMIKTETGRKMFAKMQATEYAIGLHTNKPNDGAFGKTDATWSKDEKGNDVVQRVDVYVNTNSMKMWKNQADGFVKSNKLDVKSAIKETPDGEDKQFYQDYYLMSTGRFEDVVGATGSHEAEHATNMRNLMDDKENKDNRRNPQPGYQEKDVESVPNKVEQQDLNERTQ